MLSTAAENEPLCGGRLGVSFHAPATRAMSDSAGTHPQGSEGAVHAQLVALAEEWATAIVSNNAARIASFMDDEWVIVSESGVSSKEQFLSVVESGELTHSAMQRVSEPRIRAYGDTAVYTARVTNTAHHLGRQFDADEWTTDVFVQRNGRWLCVLSHIATAAPA
ncbi:nuclear transport factor 2 family protein [Kribbella sp. NBC_01245]|uniref:nuclear transport factor 2 family protein n=1 Tax=Kribbella sp. NBC_01245 TaxID=2903578 RepID=UPI002E2C218D|nr:nuclear transport factor 2 family protein [Kribbella sp. NBC_01245]